MKQRIEFVDLAKGICIMLVVQIHVFGDSSYELFKDMSVFRMPLYYFLSGIFFKTYGDFTFFIKKKVNRLLIPFIFFYICSILPLHFVFDFYLPKKEVTFGTFFFSDYGRLYHHYNGAIWFLVSLFIANIYFYFIYSLVKGRFNYMIIMAFFCGLIGFYMNKMNIYIPLWLDTSLTALPFFVLGYMFRQKTSLLSPEFSRSHFMYALCSLFLLVCVILFNYIKKTHLVDYDTNTYNLSWMRLYIGGISGLLLVLLIAKKVNYLYIISYLGRYSIVVLCTHLVYLFIIRNIFYQFNIPQDNGYINTIVYIIIMLLSLPTIKFGIKYLPYFFAQKDMVR